MAFGFGQPQQPSSALEYRRAPQPQPKKRKRARFNTNNPAAAAAAWAAENGIPYWEALKQVGRVTRDTTLKEKLAADEQKLADAKAAKNRELGRDWYRNRQRKAAEARKEAAASE